MSAPQFTKGPWDSLHAEIFDARREETVCVIEEDRDEWVHNVHLIAAAPDLYEALDDLVDAVLNDVDKSRRIARAQAALAKARGQS